MPLAWKYLLYSGKASYQPSRFDEIAQPKPDQIQNHIPEVYVNDDGSYEIKFGKSRRFYNGTLQVYFKNQYYSAHPVHQEKALNFISKEESSDSDVFGSFKRILMRWELEGTTISVNTSIIIYPNQPIIKFQIEFPMGLKDVTTGEFNTPIFKFPCFNLEGPNQKILAYRYFIFSPSTKNIPEEGTHGPVVFYDNELNAAVLGPMDHFMIAFSYSKEQIFHGFEGKIQEIPEGYEHSALLFFTQGINKAIVDWCAFLQKYHNTIPKDPYADPIIANIGFWTDNGAYYYYRKEKDMSYEQTIAFACKTFQELSIPFKYFQLDSWWYLKDMKPLWKVPPFSWLGRLIGGGAYGGTLLWEPLSEEFSNGLKTLHERIGLPFACHARWFSTKSPYIEKYKFTVAESAALPLEPVFWEDLMKDAAEKGIILYEQDWIINTFRRIPLLQEDINAAEQWLTWMAEAAHKNGITIQYCMAPSGAFLYALKLPAVTNARVTGDYHARVTKQFFFPQFTQTNILAWGVGIWPSLDCFLTTTTPLRKGLYREKYPEQVCLLSNLGGGLICPADKAERVNKDLLMKTCTEEGLILKPDRPITVNDLMFKIHQKPYIMDTWTQKDQLIWRYIVVVNLWPRRVKDTQVTLRELGYQQRGVLYNFLTGDLSEIDLDDKIDLQLNGMGYKYYILAPFIKENIALIGTTDKFVTCANKLIPEIQINSSSVIFQVNYSLNSQLKLLLYSKTPPQKIQLKDASGTVKWDYNQSLHRLEISLTFSTSNSNQIILEFSE